MLYSKACSDSIVGLIGGIIIALGSTKGGLTILTVLLILALECKGSTYTVAYFGEQRLKWIA